MFLLYFLFELMREERIQITLKVGLYRPAAKRHWNGISLVGRCRPNIECWLGSFVIFLGIGTSSAKKLYIFVMFLTLGGLNSSLLGEPSGSAHGLVPVLAYVVLSLLFCPMLQLQYKEPDGLYM